MSKYRTSAYDAPAPPIPKTVNPGIVPENKIGIYDQHGNLRGHVGPKATAATARRFGVENAELTKKDGRLAWCGKRGSK